MAEFSEIELIMLQKEITSSPDCIKKIVLKRAQANFIFRSAAHILKKVGFPLKGHHFLVNYVHPKGAALGRDSHCKHIFLSKHESKSSQNIFFLHEIILKHFMCGPAYRKPVMCGQDTQSSPWS